MVSVCWSPETGRRIQTRATSSRFQASLLRWCWWFLSFCSISLHFVWCFLGKKQSVKFWAADSWLDPCSGQWWKWHCSLHNQGSHSLCGASRHGGLWAGWAFMQQAARSLPRIGRGRQARVSRGPCCQQGVRVFGVEQKNKSIKTFGWYIFWILSYRKIK